MSGNRATDRAFERDAEDRPLNDRPTEVATARALLRIRALRWDYFRGDLFDEYAWNILLVLFIAEAGGRETGETMAIEEASVPLPVGLRWITHLEHSKLVARGADGTVRMTAHSRAEMSQYLHEAGTMFQMAG